MTTPHDPIAALADLRTKAPRDLIDRTLAATGHHDTFTIVDGPSGRLAVAFNPRGVSGVVPADGEPPGGAVHDGEGVVVSGGSERAIDQILRSLRPEVCERRNGIVWCGHERAS